MTPERKEELWNQTSFLTEEILAVFAREQTDVSAASSVLLAILGHMLIEYADDPARFAKEIGNGLVEYVRGGEVVISEWPHLNA